MAQTFIQNLLNYAMLYKPEGKEDIAVCGFCAQWKHNSFFTDAETGVNILWQVVPTDASVLAACNDCIEDRQVWALNSTTGDSFICGTRLSDVLPTYVPEDCDLFASVWLTGEVFKAKTLRTRIITT